MTTIKMKNGNQYKIKKNRIGKGIMPIKALRVIWSSDTFQTQHPM